MNLVTNFESTRMIFQEKLPEQEDSFYEGCSLLESTLGEISYHDEIDYDTEAIYELLLKYIDECALKGASESKQKIIKISTFAAIAQVLGKVEESSNKRVGEKSAEQKITEFYKLYPHIGEIEAQLGKLQFSQDHYYYYARNDQGVLEKLPLDLTAKRPKRNAEVSNELRKDGTTTEYIYKGELNKRKTGREGKGKVIWPEGVSYEGGFFDDKQNGFGRLIHRLRDVYEGDWFENKAHGPGIYYHMNGVKYVGTFFDDLPHGNGVEEWPDGSKYDGQFVEEKKKGKGFLNGTVEMNIEEASIIILCGEKGFICGLMGEAMKESGEMENSMEMEYLNGQMEECIKETIKIMKNMAMGSISGQMAEYLEEIGKEESSMEKATTLQLPEKQEGDCGKMVKDKDGLE
eukprot:CAMPEP_0202949740 /NCGR_PEP_ID=MMETSP1395-20130829/16576_1 /ASSEMBLY_ACC=CAM_ASM_000871 /TAXON_ID=5961 /ORGANISM="Blepharisma japonicum, Strain Stock R1072" /LENGTH=402 /DNA_ID=CAMNT_0049653031 /DNA_START=359 /DNA_END=1565 /DNA_ORIENTATION=+